MSIQFNQISEGLTRSGSYFNPAADWTMLFWAKCPTVTGTDTNNLYVFGDPTYADSHIDIYFLTGGIKVTVFDGITASSIGAIAIDFEIWKSFALTYTSSTTTLTLYVNGVSVGTLVVNLATFVFPITDEYLFTDTAGEPELQGGLEIFNVRTWQNDLSAVQINTENFSNSAVVTASLLTDTPLTNDSDLTDDSGNGRNWTTVGSGGSRTSPTLISGSANTTSGVAVDLVTTPKTIIQNARASGTTVDLFFKITATVNQLVLGSFGFGQTGYTPNTRVFKASDLVAALFSPSNLPAQFLVSLSATREFYFKSVTNSSAANPAYLVLDVQEAPDNAVAIGDIFVNDDTEDFPLSILSATEDYVVKKFVEAIVAGESGCVLPNGTILLADDYNNLVVGYDRSFVEIASNSFGTLSHGAIRSNRALNKFYAAKAASPNSFVRIYDSLGAYAGIEYTLTAIVDIGPIATNNAGTLLYYADTSINSAEVRVWNLSTGVAGANLVANLASNYVIGDILVLPDDTLIVMYSKSGGSAVVVKHYSAAGATLNTYSIGTNDTTTARLAYGVGTPENFWAGTHDGDGGWVFQKIRVSDGVVLTTRLHAEFELGVYEGTASSNPPRFGASFSCPFLILTATDQPSFRSGLYQIVPGKRNDTLYDEDGTTEDVKIPEPSATSFMIGDE